MSLTQSHRDTKGNVFVLASAANVANFNLQLQCLSGNTGAERWDADRLHTCIFAH